MLEQIPLQIDSSRKESCCYISHTEKTNSKTTTQQTSYIKSHQLWQAHVRSKWFQIENYLVLLLTLVLVTKSGSRSIQFLQEELLKNFDATCDYAMSAVLPKGRQMLSVTVMVQITSTTKKHSRVQGRLAVLVLLKQQIHFTSRYVVEDCILVQANVCREVLNS